MASIRSSSTISAEANTAGESPNGARTRRSYKSRLRGTETLSEQTGHLPADAVSPATEEIMKVTMEQYMFDKVNGIWYKLEGDYYIPCVTA